MDGQVVKMGVINLRNCTVAYISIFSLACMVELRLGLRAKLRLSVIICAVLDLLPTKKKINRQHRRRFADIETISKR